MPLVPSETRLSPHFLLSDMIGNHSVYTQGLANTFDKKSGHDIRLDNAKALCEHALEPVVALLGSISISYGFISPAVSQEIVHYQDPRKPSHHRWDLGAAVDICPHYFVLQTVAKEDEWWTSPINLALQQFEDFPLSRLITYSESPFMCVAVSAEEVSTGNPRKMYYENRYQGKKRQAPKFIKYASAGARDKAAKALQEDGLPAPWQGHGYPTYHGGGRRQWHHVRCSDYTMVSDFLYDEYRVMHGIRNTPAMNIAAVKGGFNIAGEVYDTLLHIAGLPRLSIVSAYTCELYESPIEGRDWRGNTIEFEIVPPEYCTPPEFIKQVKTVDSPIRLGEDGDRVIVSVDRRAWHDYKQGA